MKTLLLTTVALFIAAVTPARAVELFLKATVIGTVQTQLETGIGAGRIHTAVLNDQRIFQEFQVSKDDYQLVVEASGGGGLLLVPKLTTSGLPTLTVLAVGTNGATVIDTTAHLAHYVSGVSNSAATNLFQGAVGEASGTVRFKGSLLSPVITKFSYGVICNGTDQTGTGSALLKFKVTTGGVFTPAS